MELADQKFKSPYHRVLAQKEAAEAEANALRERITQLESGKTPAPEADAKATEVAVEDHDDRNDLVEVTYGRGAITPENTMCVYKKKVPKAQALEELVRSYITRKSTERMIPRDDFLGKPVNDATCYIKFVKRDITGEVLTSYRDVPLWIAAERIVNHPRYTIELVKKSEWDAWMKKEQDKEREWQKPLTQGQIQKAVVTLANQAELIKE